MENIVAENVVPFKCLEQEIFRIICEIGRRVTVRILEDEDRMLFEGRNKKFYRDKGKKQTTVKTIYGEVTYVRHVYQTPREGGGHAYVFLLDEKMCMEKFGLVSSNLAEKAVLTATEAPYRVAAEQISRTCGQSMSAQGVWNLVQRVGEGISKEEDFAVSQMKADQSVGEKVVGILFEEMDGVWLRMQGEHHEKAPGKEMKVFTMYEGWDAERETARRSTLVGRGMMAGMEAGNKFHEKREAYIRQKYNADEIGRRILNGDGGSWIREDYDPDAIFQLDRFHVCQAILRYIRDGEAQKEVRRLFDEEKPDEMLDYIKTYADSVASDDEGDKRSENATKLYQYLSDNKGGLLPYQKRGIALPEPPDGVIYKNMGVQENENCTLVTLRMKHRRMRWSVSGANNMGKVLARKSNGDLLDIMERMSDGTVMTLREMSVNEVLSAAKVPTKSGSGNSYVDAVAAHMPLKDSAQSAARRAFIKAICE